MDITNLCNDMFVEIHRHLSTKQLIQLTCIDKRYRNLITNTVWPRTVQNKRYLIGGYKFRNYVLRITPNTKGKFTKAEYNKLLLNLDSRCDVTLDELSVDRKLLKSLHRVRKLRIVRCIFDKLTIKDHMGIRKVPIIKIIGCKRIPLIYLKSIHIYKFAPVKITNKIIPFLPNITKLDLSLCDKNVSKIFGTMPNVTKVNFSGSFARINNLDKLIHVTGFDLTQCDVTIDDFIHLIHAKSMKLGMDHAMKDDGISYLVNLTYLSIGPDDSFIGTAFKYLTKLETLYISCCPIIEDNLVYLTNLKYLTLDMCAHISDAGLVHLKHLQKLEILTNGTITDDGLVHLSGINELILLKCYRITDEGLKYLANIRRLTLVECGIIIGHGLKYLTGVKRLSISYNFDLEGWSLGFLPPIDKLYLTECPEIYDEDLLRLSHVRVLGIHECCEIIENGLSNLPNVFRVKILPHECY